MLVVVAVSGAALWTVLVVALVLVRPPGGIVPEALRLVPDTLVVLKRLATDPALPRGVRVRLWLLFAYLAIPFDLVPDFLPLVGMVDDAILVLFTIRSVIRRAGPEALRRHWPGTPEGLATLARAAGIALDEGGAQTRR
jgi:uncharacterized membrane protein YkvA (DUF1232 family)